MSYCFNDFRTDLKLEMLVYNVSDECRTRKEKNTELKKSTLTK